MYIDHPKPKGPETREMKVRIPSDIHMQLHTMKLLTGKGISDAVTEALQIYFQHLQELKAQEKAEAEAQAQAEAEA